MNSALWLFSSCLVSPSCYKKVSPSATRGGLSGLYIPRVFIVSWGLAVRMGRRDLFTVTEVLRRAISDPRSAGVHRPVWVCRKCVSVSDWNLLWLAEHCLSLPFGMSCEEEQLRGHLEQKPCVIVLLLLLSLFLFLLFLWQVLSPFSPMLYNICVSLHFFN